MLKKILKKNRQKGAGYRAGPKGTLDIYKKGAFIDDITFHPREYGNIKLEFVPNNKNAKMPGHTITLSQFSLDKKGATLIGGQTFSFSGAK